MHIISYISVFQDKVLNVIEVVIRYENIMKGNLVLGSFHCVLASECISLAEIVIRTGL